MSTFFVSILFIIAVFCAISWIVPKFLAWLFKRKYKIDLKIGRIGLPFVSLHDVFISKNGYSIQLQEVGFKSSFFSSEVTKLISLVIKDVRIKKDIDVSYENGKMIENETEFSFQDKKIPPVIITFVQFMAVHIYSLSIMFLRAESPEWLIHATAGEVHLDGSIVHNARTLLVNASVHSANAKLLRHAVEKEKDPQTCLTEISFDISLEGTVIAQGPMSVEKLYVGMLHSKAVINERFYSFAQKSYKKKNISSDVTKFDDFDVLQKFYPIIPKNFTLKVENLVLTGMKEDNRIDYSSNLHSLLLNTQVNNQNSSLVKQLFLSLQVNNLDVECERVKVLQMSKLSIDGNFEDYVINVYLVLDTLSVNYHHLQVHPWVVSNFLKINQKDKLTRKTSKILKITRKQSWWEKICNKCQLSGCVELWKVSLSLKLPGEAVIASFGFSHTKLMLEHSSDVRQSSHDNSFSELLFGKKQWVTEVLVESCWYRLGNVPLTTDTHILRKYHNWGTPLFLGVVLVKVKSHGNREIKINAMIDMLRTEWSPTLSHFIEVCLNCFQDYNTSECRDVHDIVSVEHTSKNKLSVFTINLNLSNTNLFFLANNKVCLMLRLDKTTIESSLDKTGMLCEGVKLASLVPTACQHNCVKSDEIKLMCGHVKLARINFKPSTRDLTIQLQDKVHVKWSANLHLKLLTLYNEVKEFLQTVSGSTLDDQPSEVHDKNTNWALRINGQAIIDLHISSKHGLTIEASELTGGSTPEYVGVESVLVKISVDNQHIFTFDNLQVCRIADSEEIRNERRNSDDFVLDWNKTWAVNAQLFKACFPHEHNYADAVHNELISLWKWLKIVHNKKKTPFTSDSPLPSDIVFKIKEFLFEMSDDPFEVKLRDNFELLEDEYKESVKRQKMLDAKVAELRKSHVLSMTTGKIEELNAGLSKKNAEIYVQRSKQMSKQAPVRTRLFAWLMNDLQIMLLADPSVHGYDNVVRIITEIDCDSPWPEDGLEFSTFWCRSICVSWSDCKFQLRDFPQPLLDIRSMQLFGKLAGGEQEATRRAKREVVIEQGDPWPDFVVERSMTALKFYHDLNCYIQHFRYAFGPCWEPVIAQCNLSFEKISPPSKDPSPPLAFWDKMRLLCHGRLTMYVRQLTSLLHASLDPYNTTEEMELTWTDVAMDWTNGKFIFKGDFNVYVRTASKYDDCRLLHLPNLKLVFKLLWLCLADPNDHHSVMPCAPNKQPEYSINQEHDSYRAFRSQNVSVSVSLETKQVSSPLDCPIALFYGSTLRWFENLKLILSGVTRPTRRGAVFSNVRPKKIPLSRHYKKVRLLVSFHRFQVAYWMSFAMQRGFELLGGRVTFNSEHSLNLVGVDDGLKHRHRPDWSILCMNCDLNDAEIWLKSALQEDEANEKLSVRHPVEKCYCLSLAKVSYVRETIIMGRVGSSDRERDSACKDTPTHRLVVYDLKGAWTKSNRDVVFALFDTLIKSKQLKKNLSTEALKGFRGEAATNSLKSRTPKPSGESLLSGGSAAQQQTVSATPSPLSKQQTGQGASMLQQLIAEVDNKSVVFSDDLSVQTAGQHLLGLQSCQDDDVQYKNWLIVLVNSQVLLKGCETKGYVILSAARAEITQKVHVPAWKDRTLVSKTSWVGSLECMQYYATVAAGGNDKVDENIMWLTLSNIQEKETNCSVISAAVCLPDLVGSGHSVGGVVTETVGASSTTNGHNSPVQLQRIVSRCKCEFFYACYGETNIDPSTLDQVPPLPMEETVLWGGKETAVDAFTLMHYDLDCCTNSLQYSMILDIVNNLLLHLEPRRKEFNEKLQRMRFQLALHSTEDQRKPIQDLQNHVRSLVSKLRRLERESYLIQKMLNENDEKVEMDNLDEQVYECKDLLLKKSEELDMMLSCYKESQLSAYQKLITSNSNKPVTSVRAYEIVFKHATWRLTETDGQLGIADIVLSNFLYTKNSKSDDSVEHLLQLGYVRMTNLLPNQAYTEVLQPTEIQTNMPIDRKTAVRVFCREKAPVGGISVKEHFEINVVPITIGITKMFFNTMLAFCFPEREQDMDADTSDELEQQADYNKVKKVKQSKKGKETNFYVKIEHKDDVEKMKERAEKNKLFIYIKIPEVPVRVSYKGNKEKNLEDIRDFSLVIPTLEYHNVTWTWLDLLLAMKTDSRRVILSQAIKQKLQIKTNRNSSKEGTSPQEEDKARMLFGTRVVPGTSKSLKRSVFKLNK